MRVNGEGRKQERTGIGAPLGTLEQDVMTHVWQAGPDGCTASDVQRGIEPTMPLALTTILTTLDRLLEKGIVRRSREGRPHRYAAALSREELEQRIVKGVLDRLIDRFPGAVAAYFAEPMDEDAQNPARLAKLNALAERIDAAGGASQDAEI